MPLSLSTAVAAGATAVLVPLTLKLLSSRTGSVPQGEVRYSRFFGAIAIAVGIGPPVVVALIVSLQGWPLEPREQWSIVGVVLMSSLLGGPLLAEWFGVRHSYSVSWLDYRTALRRRRVSWDEVTRLTWRPQMKWLDMHTSKGTLHFSPLLGGLEDFARIARSRLPKEVLGSSPAGAAVLELMEHGVAGSLSMSPTPPEVLLAQGRERQIRHPPGGR